MKCSREDRPSTAIRPFPLPFSTSTPSPTAGSHKGFSAGSYKDMTRVAWLNPQMWAELFLENRDYLMQELSVLSENLAAYQKALETQDLAGLTKLLDDGKRRKEEVDGR